MIDLSKIGKSLPDSIELAGSVFLLHTDFQYWITFTRMAKEGGHKLEEFDMFYKKNAPEFKAVAFQQLLTFAYPPKELPRNVEEEQNTDELLDYNLDSDLIYAAFRQYYNINLLDPSLHLHWHEFLALLQGLKETKLNDVMGFRNYTPGKNDSKEYQSQMMKLKAMWRIEKEITETEEELIRQFEKKNHIK